MKILPLTRILFSVATLSVAAALPSQAQMIANALTNGSFETQSPSVGTGKENAGFAALTGFANISAPGASQAEDSGVQYGATTGAAGVQGPESGSYFAFEKGQDPGAFQITATTLTLGAHLTLTWYAADSYLAPVQEVGILTAGSTTAAFTAATQVAVANGSTNAAYALPAYPAGMNPAGYSMYTLTYTATAADVGKNVGIFFENIGPTGNYLNTDNYDLAITSAVPEPRTYGMVIMGAVAAFLVIRRRKQALSKSLSV